MLTGSPTSTGGLPQLIALREQIFTGVDREEAYGGYLESLGALAIRGQVWDAIGGILIDPVNFIMPYIKPVEKLTALNIEDNPLLLRNFTCLPRLL